LPVDFTLPPIRVNLFNVGNPIAFLEADLVVFSGIVIVLIGWPFIGILIETVGFFMLFGSYLQTVVNFTKATPVYSYACKVPGVRQMFDYCDVHKFPV